MEKKVDFKNKPSDSSSLSFLDLKWGSISDNEIEGLIYPDSLDPLYSNVFIETGPLLDDLLRKIQNINFIYKSVEDNILRIVNLLTKESIIELQVVDFTKVLHCTNEETNMFMILNKQTLKKNCLSRLNRSYKENISKGSQVIKVENEFDKINLDLYTIQIEKKLNFIFIDSHEDLQREIKNLLKSVILDKEYVPKVKSFKTDKKQDHFEYVLSKIPGISQCVAKNIANKFKSFLFLHKFISENGGNELENLLIWDDENKKCRPLGRKQVECILKVFLSGNEDELLS